MAKKILYFSDLEGTILRDLDGEFEDMEFYKLVEELTKLGELTDSEVELRLISPIGFKRMNRIVERMEKIIARHSALTGKDSKVYLEEAAASAFDIQNEMFIYRTMSKKITELPRVIHSDSDPARTAKRKYVDLVFQTQRKTDENTLCIYAGNGSNDIEAMKYIKRKGNGILICPKNSVREVRAMSHFTSEDSDIRGIIDCMKRINEKVAERKGEKIDISQDKKERSQQI